MKPYFRTLGAILGALTLTVSAARAADELVIYSARNEQLIKPLFDA
ncbi:MAG: Fe(3+) ABC transporter substrate-binding protein, partial [Pseudomonadota bacterium]